MDRSNSIAADTRLDDPRSFSVYLAHHGSVIKVGITATERGDARLLEQGAFASAIISAGSLVGARRIEILLGSVLGLPDRVSTSRKREARTRPGSAAERSTELRSVVEQAAELEWPLGQERREVEIRDHAACYALPDDGLYAEVAMVEPVAGGMIGGRIVCAIGSDLYLDTAAGLALVDLHLLAGWTLERAAAGAVPTVRLEKLQKPPPIPDHEQDALF